MVGRLRARPEAGEAIDVDGITPKLTDRQAIELALEVLDVLRVECEAGHPSYADFVLIVHTIPHGHPHPPVELSEADPDQALSAAMLRAAFPQDHTVCGFVDVL